MTKVKRIIFKIIVIYLIIYMMLGSIGSVFADTGYDAAAGEYLSQYTREYISTYVRQRSDGTYNTKYDTIPDPCYWTGGSDGEGIWHVCCTTGVQLMYKQALGIDLQSYGYSLSSGLNITSIRNENSLLRQYFDVITEESQLRPGDIMCGAGHTEMYVGNGEHLNSGADSHGGTRPVAKIVARYNPFGTHSDPTLDFLYAIRLKGSIAVDPSGIITSTGALVATSYADFFFNGIPDGKYSLASRKNIFEILVDALKELVGFLSGLIGYLIRGFFVGIISIFDRLINNTVQSLNDAPKSLQETGVSATSADDPYSMYRSITIEGLIFNTIDLFDINIFKVD